MSLWKGFKYLMPSYRRAQENDMREELESLARIAGAAELGNLTRAAEEARGVWGWTWVEQLYRDLQYAARTIRHNMGFTTTAALSLALGIGANTAIFSLMDGLMFRWLPVNKPEELVQLKLRAGHGTQPPNESFSNAIVAALAERKDIFSNVAGFSPATFDVGARGSIVRVPGAWVTGEYYVTLGLNAAYGRLLEPADDRPGAPFVAVISYPYWEREFLSSPEVIGKVIPINSHPVVIVGVSPRGFEGANVGFVADITMPTTALASLEPAFAAILNPGNFWLRALARPQHGVSVDQAQARLSAVWPQIAEAVISKNWPAARRKEMAESSFVLSPGGTGYSFLRGIFERPLAILMALTGLVLLIACANVACLLLARATARQREISVRLAIGAGRARIIRQLLTESTLLSMFGAVLGIGLAWLTSAFLVGMFARGFNDGAQIVFDMTPNWHILAFASGVAITTGILFGLAPAIQTTSIGGVWSIKDQMCIARSRSRVLTALITAQITLALVLLVGAGLFARTLQNLLNVDPGFRREGVLVVNLDGKREGYHDDGLTEFYSSLLHRVRQVPGVVSASLSSHTPLSGSSWSEAVMPKGQPLPQKDNALFIAVGPRFFATMATPLSAGRDFDDRDHVARPTVAIVNQTFAARYFPNRNPIGEYLSATITTPPSDLQIIGVVKDVATRSLRQSPTPIVYVSYFQRSPRNDALVIRAAGSLSQTQDAIRKQLQPSFPNSVLEVHALNDQVERTLVQERLLTSLTGGFGVLGLTLACVGLYGVLGYSVVRRTREIGIRIALGAQQRGVRWMIVSKALRVLAVGAVLGVAAAWVASRWLESMLFGLKPADPTVLAGAVLLLIGAGLLAAYIPANRATRVDPVTALRVE